MFDFSFGEILIVGLVALVVLGPERLPKAARFVGLWVRRARAQWYSVKSELEHELASEELRRGLADGKRAMQDAEAQLRATDADIRASVDATVAEVKAPLNAGPDAPGEDELIRGDLEQAAPAQGAPAQVALERGDHARDQHGH